MPRDIVMAAKCYRLAAVQGHAAAQYNLGVLYTIGQGVPRDDAKAAKWYRLAADQSVAAAQYSLGLKYDNGRGVPQDFVPAHLWLDLAAAAIPALDAKDLDDAIASRDDVATRMTSEQLGDAQRLAQEWLAAHPKS
jgi:TPR repeat protein